MKNAELQNLEKT